MQKSSYYNMVIFLHPLESIININGKLINYFNCNIYDLFLNNYCLEYYNILKKIYPNSYMVLEKNKEHIAILIDDAIYDVTGLRENNDFILADSYNINFVNSFYKKFDSNTKRDLYLNIFGNSIKKK